MQPRVNPLGSYRDLVPDTIRITMLENATKMFLERFLRKRTSEIDNGIISQSDMRDVLAGLASFRRGEIAMQNDAFYLAKGNFRFVLKETNRMQGLFEAVTFEKAQDAVGSLSAARRKEVKVGYEIKV